VSLRDTQATFPIGTNWTVRAGHIGAAVTLSGTRWGDPGVRVDRTSAPSWPKRVGGGRRFLVGRLGHVIALAAVGTLREKVPVAPDEQVEG
jgi:hypothetical protein